MPQEASDAIAYGPVKEGIGIRRFDNAALAHEYHLVGDMARKTHLMGDDHHCRAAFCERDDDVRHLLDLLTNESSDRLVEPNGRPMQGQGDGRCYRLMMPAGKERRVLTSRTWTNKTDARKHVR